MGTRRRDAVALIGALALVVGAVWIAQEIRTSADPVDTATVFAAYLGVATLLVTLLAFLIPWWWKGRGATAAQPSAARLRAAADQLAQRMLETWRQEANERRIGTPAPVRVHWKWGSAELTPPPAELTTAPAAGIGPRPLPEPNPDQPSSPGSPRTGVLLEAGVVTRLHDEVYCRLPHGRLVLLGGPGAGKTSAMILLLLAALDHRHSRPETRRAEIPVPVWLTLGGWDPTTQTLYEWAAATMYRDHPYLRAPDYGPDAATELLRTGRVALFLDGLDEMAPVARSKALARVEQEGAGLRLVLSSRVEEYRHVLTANRLHNTAVIELQPVDPAAASAYLLHDQIGTRRERWTQVGTHLTEHPDSIAAHALNNPLTLSLARVTYQDQDPTPLTNPAEYGTVTALREHLIDRIMITAYPDERQRDHATRWLAWIAHHLGADRDLAWWRIPTWIPRRQLRLAVGFAGGLAGGVTFGLMVGSAGGLKFGPAGGLLVGLAGGLTFGLMTGLMVGLPIVGGKEPKALLPRWPRPRELPGLLALGLMMGLLGGLGSLLVAGLVGDPGTGLVGDPGAGLGYGPVVTFGLGLGYGLLNLWTVPLPHAATATPASTARIDRRTSTAFGLMVGVAVGLAAGLVVGLAARFTVGPTGGLMVGLAVGLLVVGGYTLVGGLIAGSMSKVGFTELVLALTGAGRVTFMRVLEDAHHRQVLRQAGAVYQFRHAELQDHLAKLHHQRTAPPGPDR